ncbi:unnamed protein product [Chondrus crispus]|uniref:Reverse transcriptase Ty1/copia-type domain-containing protein n=1 Tax=Chondrus crispus TaxID=2769 RepID=R7QRN9_CHOCR|nr:unnamed protein product [Chondrus crispus]CDF40005.1 unnamed protein product [Chondrus crispus]|eukprot:XP_005710299.1 unnamed protein product [Chondrus crispus]
MAEAAPQTTPYLDGASIDPPNPNEPQDHTITEPFRAALGEIRYNADCTRPDLAFATAALARATNKPTTHHWQAMKRTVRYLLATTKHDLFFPSTSTKSPLLAYSDADFANDQLTRKSFSGTVYQLCGATVHWHSKQQPLVAQSTCEAEYIAAAETVQGAIWLRNMLNELEFTQDKLTTQNTDNAAAIRIARNTAPTKRRKCIDIKYHILQDFVQHNAVSVQYVPSKQMYADIMTKPLKTALYEAHRANLGVKTIRQESPNPTHPHRHCPAARASGGL